MRPTIYLLAIVFLFIYGCSEDKPVQPGPDSNNVAIQNNQFVPNQRTIQQNEKVDWVNQDGIDHNVTSGTPGSPDGLFNSGMLTTAEVFSYTFKDAGTYRYFCSVHPEMTGTIIVEPYVNP